MFIQDNDYKVVIGSAALSVVSQVDSINRANAEKEAIEEIAGYLRPQYDVEKIFGAEGEERNAHIVMITCDIALYHMASSLSGRMGYEVRKERYERAVKWLEGVQSGKIMPDLPLTENEDGQKGQPLLYGSHPKRNQFW